jgi:KDO2-lipid IV(A) lauroyltransferase
MDFFIFIISFGLIWLLSWLPLKVLYVFSDICFFFIWYIIPYRKKLVFKNLSLSFPEKGPQEIRIIAKQSYRHFCDNFIESIAAVHLGLKEHNKRYKLNNIEVLDELYAAGKDIMLISAHYGNWEWLSILPFFTHYKILAVYKTLHNKYFDRIFINLRNKYGVIPVTKEKTLRTIIDYQQTKIPVMTYLLGDQRPRWKEIQHWIRFLNQDTSVILGPEKIARKLGLAVVFIKHLKVRRGYYESVFIPLASDPANTKPHEITEKYYQNLESIIRDSPAEYLWTHDRWKHTWKKNQYKGHQDSQATS